MPGRGINTAAPERGFGTKTAPEAHIVDEELEGAPKSFRTAEIAA